MNYTDDGIESAASKRVTLDTRRFLATPRERGKQFSFFQGYSLWPRSSKELGPQWQAGHRSYRFETDEDSLNRRRTSGNGLQCRRTRGVAAFTLVEALIALGLLGIFIAACLSSIVLNQVCDRKAKEEAIAMNFLTKYVENIKALPFTSLAPGLPINSIYNGAGGAPLIPIPTNSSWVPLNTTAFQTFYPDLLWLSNLNPTMQVTLAQNTNAGVLHDIEVNVKMDWNAPLAKGGKLEVQVDFLRTLDVPTL